MPDSVLVALDGSPLSERALAYAVETFPDAAITTLHVIDPIDSVYDVEAGGLPVATAWADEARERAARIHERAKAAAGGRYREIDRATEFGKPARTIVEYATSHGVDQIVVGSHGREGINRALFGSVAEAVTRRAGIPVTVVR